MGLLAWGMMAAALGTAPVGVVDRAALNGGVVEFAGWAVGSGGERPSAVEAWVGGARACDGAPAELERPDVRQVLGRPELGRVGWALSCELPPGVGGGELPVRVWARFGNGERVELAPSTPAAAQVSAPGLSLRLSVARGAGGRAAWLFLLLAVSLAGVGGAEWLSRRLSPRWPRVLPPAVAAAALACAFAGLVALGVTGSSLELGREAAGGLLSSDGRLLAGKPREIRSDEWLVLTPLALAQSAHAPRFPVVNRNLGPDGQNMLVVGMVGVPVLHLSSLARPATWGHFLFDLRRALAWQWWLPVFGGLFALWWVMAWLVPGRWQLGLSVAALFTTSAYAVAWSHWPAYAVAFPAVGLCTFLHLLRARSLRGALSLGALLGWAVAGFVLVLYPPWQVSVGYLFLLLAVALVVRDREELQWARRHLCGLVVGLGVAATLVGAWWVDARPAVASVNATVYPGRRVAVTGGGMSAADFARGFDNPLQHWDVPAPVTNPSESASFPYLFPVVLAGGAVGLWRGRRPGPVEWALAVFCAGAVAFQFLGLPVALARVTLWGRVPESRVDLSLGLASLLACGVLVSNGGVPRARRVEGLLAGCAWAGAVAAMAGSGQGVQRGSSAWAVAAAVAVLSWTLWQGAWRSFAAGGLAVGALTVLPFNPWVLAPSRWEETLPGEGPLLSVGSQVPAMMLLGAGVPVANGVFHYPQPGLFRGVDPLGASAEVTNRYQHLLYEPAPSVSGPVLDSPQPDVVRVKFDPSAFDFASSGAARVLAPPGQGLSVNPSLGTPASVAGYLLYPVRGGGPR